MESYFRKVSVYDFSSENVGSLGTKDFLNVMIGVENRVMIVLNIMKGIKTGSKYYVFNIGVENRVKIYREKTQENLGMKTWIHLIQSYLTFRVTPLKQLSLAEFSGELVRPKVYENNHKNVLGIWIDLEWKVKYSTAVQVRSLYSDLD